MGTKPTAAETRSTEKSLETRRKRGSGGKVADIAVIAVIVGHRERKRRNCRG